LIYKELGRLKSLPRLILKDKIPEETTILMAGPPLVLLMVAGRILSYFKMKSRKKDMAFKSFLGGMGGKVPPIKKRGTPRKIC